MRSFGNRRLLIVAMTFAAWLGWSVAGGETPSTEPVETPAPLQDSASAQPSGSEPTPVFFNGIEPGKSTISDVEHAWGKPIHSTQDRGQRRSSYTMEPFERAEVLFAGDHVEAIVLHLREQFAPDRLAAELDLGDDQPVTVYSNIGAAVGVAYPARGVALSYQVGVEPPQVTRIMIEQPNSETFVLRARSRLPYHTIEALDDVTMAIGLNQNYAPAHALEAEIFASLGRYQDARAGIERAMKIDPATLRYRLLAARLTADLGDYAAAIENTEKILGAKPTADIKAQAIAQLGDLVASGPNRQNKLAMDYHLQAIQLAQPLVGTGSPSARREARAVLLNAHLAAANDIAQGQWRMKPQVVVQWIERAEKLADETRSLGNGEAADKLVIARGALAACAELEGQLDPTPWVEALLSSGRRSLEKSHDRLARQRLEWEIGAGLFDAMRCCADRGDFELATTHGQRAVAYFEGLADERQLSPTEHYMLGRLYFRLGSITAIHDKDHPGAIVSFNRALDSLSKSATVVPAADMRRAGETLVSMAVSYWAIGEQEKAVSLTQQGLQWIERAVRDGSAEERVLAVPYANMATMLRYRGEDQRATKFETMASRLDPAKIR